MSVFNLKTAALAIAAGVGLSGCAYGPYGGLGVGVGYGNNDYYDPYYNGRYYSGGYGGYSPYGYGGYSPYGYGRYGSPYYGWHNGYYYPGSGYYVYDRYRRPHRWSDAQQRYWQWRQRGAPRSTGGTSRVLENWADFQNGPQANNQVVRQRGVETNRVIRREVTDEQRAAWTERRQRAAEQRVTWTERRQQAAEQRSERRAARAESNDDRPDRGQRRARNRD